MALTDNYFATYAWDPSWPDRDYDATWREYGFHVFEHYLDDLRTCKLPLPGNVLDIGAANGRVIEELVNTYGIDAQGIEQSKLMYNRAAPETRKRITLGDARDVIKTLPDNSFDCVYETAAQYMEKESISDYLAQIHRVVRTDVVFLVHTTDMLKESHHEQVTHISDAEWVSMFRSAGFIVAGDPDDHPYWFQKV